MTEIPEHLLARSRSRRSAIGGGGDSSGGDGGGDAAPAASTPATTSEASAAPAPRDTTPAVPTPPAAPDPVPPWVQAAESRKKIPFWAVPVLAMLPLWAVVYALTLDTPTPTEPGPLDLGAEVYSGLGCSGCHGAGGGGAGAVPGLDLVAEHFPVPGDMVAWIALGSAGYQAEGIEEYAEGVPVQGGMPGWVDSLTAEELMSVVLHERTEYGGEEFDIAVWEEGWEDSLLTLLPEATVAEYTAVLEEWAADPPTAP